MNSAKQVDQMADEWKSQGLSKEEFIVKCAEAELGWPYVWGAAGAQCTTSKREYYANRDSCPVGEKDEIRKKCPVLSGKQQSCDGCQWFPDGERVLIDDCWGFAARQIMSRVGISLAGYGCTSGYNDAKNWIERGKIQDMPMDKVCLVFMDKKNIKEHVGIHIGGGDIIHCSGTVKRGKITDRGWTHYAIPVGLGGDTPMPTRPTIRKGSQGADVKYLQEQLIKAGFDLGSYGADGKFGAKTEAAVKAFQSMHGLKADGIVGPMTWGEIDKIDQGKTTYYMVTIRHLPLYQAEALKERYDGAVTVTPEEE